VYNYDSIFVRLYVAYKRRMLSHIDAEVPLAEAFKRSTDGPDCPISRYYASDDFVTLCSARGFKAKFLGSAVSLLEMSLLPLRFDAMQDIRLEREHRSFLAELTFDQFARPLYRGQVAGIDAVYELRK
ncbi:MAG: hypothetical protein RDV41_05735, partial [Planctomycetota bacterium]|nr:hypothetical protein [Planctomycetota bacterium]